MLEARWKALRSLPQEARRKAFKESRDRKCSHMLRHRQSDLPGYGQPSIQELSADSAVPGILPYGFRSFDRQMALYDFRLGDFIRPDLYRIAGKQQLFFVSPDRMVPGGGPVATASVAIPDQHYFRGSYGGKDIFPLYCDIANNLPNVTGGLLDTLGAAYGSIPAAEDFAAYVYAVLGGQSYTTRYWNELETPGPRVPITKNGATFMETAALGRQLIWLHTYTDRFRGDGRGDEVPKGKATAIKGVSSNPEAYPSKFGYVPAKQEITVGDGRFGPVGERVWEFEVSGLKVVQSWLGYRMKVRKGRKSSPLDDIRPRHWTPRMSEELLELLWVLEATLAMEPQLEDALNKVVVGPCFIAADLPHTLPDERKPAAKETTAGELLREMGVHGGESEDNSE